MTRALVISLALILAISGPGQGQEQLYPGVYIQEMTVRLELARPGQPDYVLAVEIPRQTVRSDRVQVILRPERGQPVRIVGTMKIPPAQVSATHGDVLVGKITPKGETEQLTYDPSRRAVLIPLAPRRGPATQVEVVLPLSLAPPP